MHRRDVLAAVAAGMGGLASLPAGAVTGAGGGTLDVAILRTTSPVIGGSRLEVVARVTNPTSHTVTNAMQLFDSSDRVLDRRELTLDGGASVTFTLGYTTYDTKRKVTFPITIGSEGDWESQDVTVFPRESDAPVGVSIGRTSSPVTGGQFLQVTVSVANTASQSVTETIRLFDSSGTLLDSQELTLGGQSTDVVWLGWITYPVRNTVQFPVTVRSESDSESRQVTVYGTR